MENKLATATSQNFSVHQFYEYLLVVHPAPEVYAQINEEKLNFYNTYNEKIAVKTKPHITVANFLAKEEMEGTIIRYMHRILSMQKIFTVMLNNYSGFPPHTVYARVQNHEPFKQLAASLKAVDQYVRGNGCPPAKFITHPHISIARRLKQSVYEKAMLDYSQKTFNASFVVDELILLKRQTQFDKCKQVNVFRLV